MSLTRKDLKNYFKSKETSAKNSIERETIDDVFEREALEGWSESGIHYSELNKLDRKYFRRFWYKIVISSVLLAIVSLIVLLTLNTYLNSPMKSSKGETILNPNKTRPKDTIQFVNSLSSKKQIEPKSIKNDFKLKENEKVEMPTNLQSPDLTTQPLPIKKANAISYPLKQRVNIAKETYIQDFKVIDYRYYRARPASTINNDVLTGTPASSEKMENTSNGENQNIEIAYVNYLNKSLKMFSQLKFKEALNRFDLILETYPEDVNALFYSSLCLYNLNLYSKSETRLLELANSKFTNFSEEAEWYLLLSYFSQNKEEKFLELKTQIIEQKGFYSKKAKSW